MLCLQQQLEDEYCDQDDDDLGDFTVYSDDDDDELSKHKHQRQEELEDDMEEEVEEEVEPVEEVEVVEEEEEAPVGQQEILSLREQLKEEIRRKNAAMAVEPARLDVHLQIRHHCRQRRTGKCTLAIVFE